MSTTAAFETLASRLRDFISVCSGSASPPGSQAQSFDTLALALFALQFSRNRPFGSFCRHLHRSPQTVFHWTEIPAVPTAAFKEFEFTCLAPEEQTAVFYSSGTTGQSLSRHFHSRASLAMYEASLLPWFRRHVIADLADRAQAQDSGGSAFLFLSPPPERAPHSSLVHMFDTVRRVWGATSANFVGRIAADGGWELDFPPALHLLEQASQQDQPLIVSGTAFSFVQLLDGLAAQRRKLRLAPGSRAMETGGYKGRSRSVPRSALHQMISNGFGIPPHRVVSEYGMSELSSQAYDAVSGTPLSCPRRFYFPPWARAQVISPETGNEVPEGGTGLLRIYDLANVYSVMALQTEDVAVRRGGGFELIGRAESAEPRGCSLMAAHLS